MEQQAGQGEHLQDRQEGKRPPDECQIVPTEPLSRAELRKRQGEAEGGAESRLSTSKRRQVAVDPLSSPGGQTASYVQYTIY